MSSRDLERIFQHTERVKDEYLYIDEVLAEGNFVDGLEVTSEEWGSDSESDLDAMFGEVGVTDD